MNFICELRKKFNGDFTLKGRFDGRKSRAHYVLMLLHTKGPLVMQHNGSSRVKCDISYGFDDNRYRRSIDGVEFDEQQCEGQCGRNTSQYDIGWTMG